MRLFRHFLRIGSGVSAVEYGAIIALAALFCAGALKTIETKLEALGTVLT